MPRPRNEDEVEPGLEPDCLFQGCAKLPPSLTLTWASTAAEKRNPTKDEQKEQWGRTPDSLSFLSFLGTSPSFQLFCNKRTSLILRSPESRSDRSCVLGAGTGMHTSSCAACSGTRLPVLCYQRGCPVWACLSPQNNPRCSQGQMAA